MTAPAQSLTQCEDPQSRGQRRRAVTPGVNRGDQPAQTHLSRLGDLIQYIPERSFQCDTGPMAGEREAAFDQATQLPSPCLSNGTIPGRRCLGGRSRNDRASDVARVGDCWLQRRPKPISVWIRQAVLQPIAPPRRQPDRDQMPTGRPLGAMRHRVSCRSHSTHCARTGCGRCV